MLRFRLTIWLIMSIIPRNMNEKKDIYIVPKDGKNMTLAYWVAKTYGSDYKVDWLFADKKVDGSPSLKETELSPDTTALLIIPGYSGRDWGPSERAKNKMMDYLEAGGNILMICDAIYHFVRQGIIITDKLEEVYFDEGPSRLPENIMFARIKTRSANKVRLCPTIIGQKHTKIYRACGPHMVLTQGYDENKILPLGLVEKSCKSHPFAHLEDGEPRPQTFNMIYVKQGRGNLVLSSDHNEEYMPHFLLGNALASIGMLPHFLARGKKQEAKWMVQSTFNMFRCGLEYMVSGGPLHDRFNSQYRRFMYEEIFGLKNPKGPVPDTALGPNLMAIKESLARIRG